MSAEKDNEAAQHQMSKKPYSGTAEAGDLGGFRPPFFWKEIKYS